MKNFIKNKHRIIALICLSVVALALCSCATCSRACKDYNRNVNGSSLCVIDVCDAENVYESVTVSFVRKSDGRLIAEFCVDSGNRFCTCCSQSRAVKLYNFEEIFGDAEVWISSNDGELLAEYSIGSDIETDLSTYILWDDEMGKRHIVYFSTFNVIIDEN